MKIAVNHPFRNPAIRLVTGLLIALLLSTHAQAQIVVQGTVSDAKRQPLVGVNVVAKGTAVGATTQADGTYKLTLPAGATTLVYSFVGYTAQTVSVNGKTTLDVTLAEDNATLNEVVVTGVFDKRSRMESSVAISTLNSRQLDVLQPNSAADLLKNVPGVYVNSSAGEVRNIVYSRGVSANSVASVTDNTNGYYYVSLQEDGLPITAFSSGLVSPDFFFRNDATINRLEAVRGGTSSITGVNAPGGIFNFLTKAGGAGAGSEVRVKAGLEGDGKNPYYRADFNTGGGSADKSLNYNIGGFYRYAEGARYAGYPLNNGGQLKASLTKNYSSGSLKVYAKYLNDKNGTTAPLPAQGFDHITLAPGVNKSDSYLLHAGAVQVPNGSATDFSTFDAANVNHSKDLSIGLLWNQTLGNSWSLTNNAKYSDKSLLINTNVATNFTYLTDPVTYVFAGILGPPSTTLPGVITFKDRETGKTVAQVQQGFGQMGPTYTVLNANLPGAVPNALLYQGSIQANTKVNDFMDQFSVTKRLKNGSITAGVFYANSHIRSNPEMPAAVLGLTLVKDRPVPLDVSFQAVTGQNFQGSEPSTGYLKLGGSFGFSKYDYTQNQAAFFLGNNLNLTDKLNFDWGIRYESNTLKGYNDRSVPTTKAGGVDGNPLTVYDNFYGVTGVNVTNFDKSISSFSYSGGLNYKFNDNNALYIRYTKGQKSPDLSFYNTYTSQAVVNSSPPKNQDIMQIEAGYKLRTGRLKAVVTPFYSQLSNVGNTFLANDENNQFYYTPVQYNTIQTTGVEIEADWSVFNHFDLRGAFTIQNAKYANWKTWNVGHDGKADDKLVDYTGNKAENNPSLIMTVTPTYSVGKFYSFVQWKYLGTRPVNQANAYNLPAFSQFDFGTGYTFSSKLSLALNVNNVTNVLGIMGSLSPGSILEAFNGQNITKEQVAANPNAIHSVIPIQPRAYFLTATYKF